MDDPAIDLRDRRGRLIRLVIASAIGLVMTLVVLSQIESVGVAHNPDPISQASPALLGIAMFVTITSVALGIIDAISRRIGSSPSA